MIKTIDGKMELETNIEYIAYKEAINNIYSLCLNSFDNIEILKEQIKERENLVKQEINEEFVTKLTNDINLLQDDTWMKK